MYIDKNMQIVAIQCHCCKLTSEDQLIYQTKTLKNDDVRHDNSTAKAAENSTTQHCNGHFSPHKIACFVTTVIDTGDNQYVTGFSSTCSKDQVDLPCILKSNGAKARSGWTKIQETYENVHPKLILVLLFICTEVECRKSLFVGCDWWISPCSFGIIAMSTKCHIRSKQSSSSLSSFSLAVYDNNYDGHPGIHIHFLLKSSAGQVSLMIHWPGQNLGCPKKIVKLCGIFRAGYAAKESNYAADYAIFLTANFKLDFPFLKINSNSSFV